jgi:DNA-damage-inducible protein J
MMAKSATVRARVEPELKDEAEGVLHELGLNATTAITLYYEQIVKRHGLPFEVSLPNATTLRAMRSAEAGRVTRAKTARDVFTQLDADD